MKQKRDENLKKRKKKINNSNHNKKVDNIPARSKKLKKEPQKSKHSLIGKIFFIFFVVIVVSLCILAFKLYTFKTLAEEMFSNSPSTVFDINKNTIAQIGSERNRENIAFSEVPEDLVHAYISIEDKRYYTHHGVDIKRTGAAILSYITHRGSSSFGGSTITQQLVKNLTGNDTNSISRKLEEWFYACTLDASFSKEKILEAYLNIIYTGPNIYGVKEASLYYFDKDLKDLSLAQYAFLAGINNAPNTYNPFTEKDRTEKITKRTKTVLKRMLDQSYITQDNYDSAIAEVEGGLTFKKGNIETTTIKYSYHTDALINEVVSDLSEQKHISKDFATNFFYMAGTSIYSTENNDIQTAMQTEFNNKKYVLNSQTSSATSQAAMVVIDHSTGYVVGCVGGLGEKTSARTFNRATQMKRQTGSAMKPIAVLVPALSQKLITNVSVFADEPTKFIDYNGKDYTPTDYDGYKGSITLRQAVESSQNIPFVKIMEQITPQVSIKYLKKMGITTLNDNDVNLALSLGGLDKGISPLEFAGAYSTIANDGIYIEPTFYTKICFKSGQTFIESKQKQRQIISKDVACLLKELLTEPVKGKSGTAAYCSISGIDVAAKTGTTNENYDKWLCGFTPYYTAVCWYGFDINESINFGGKNPAGLIWADVMTRIHSTLPKAKFEIPSSVVTTKICRDSGKVANSYCTDTYTEYFLKGTLPDICTHHSRNNLK